MDTVAIQCPKCHESSSLLKVSGIVKQRWQTETKGTAVGGAFSHGQVVPMGFATNSQSEGSTVLANLLSPPALPTDKERYFTTLIFAILGGICPPVVAFATQNDLNPMIVAYGWMAFCWGIAAIFFVIDYKGAKAFRENAVREKPRHLQRLEAWNRLYYCSRCDVVFDPESPRAVSPEAVRSIL